MLKEGYTLPFQSRPSLTRSPKIINCYAHLYRNLYWLEALHQLMDKEWCSRASSKSLGFFNLSWFQNHTTIETYSRSEQTKPFGDHQDHPPTMGVGYLNRFQGRLLPYTNAGTVQDISNTHVQGRTYQFKALSFGLSTAPMELTVVAKELKLMAIHKGIIIHQYLDDWLVKATSHRVCLRHTLDLVKICQSLGYQFDIMAGRTLGRTFRTKY